MQQVLVIHGGDTFATREEYLAALREWEVSLDPDPPGWKSGLAAALGDAYQVIRPSMPNKQNARYEEWEIWFEKYLPFLNDGVILIGHSLGGSFLARYLSEKRLPVLTRATFLIAAPFDLDGDQTLADFAAPDSLALIEEQAGEVFLYHSTDDPVVAFSELDKFRTRLPHAHTRIFEDRGHFNQETLPELLAEIRGLK